MTRSISFAFVLALAAGAAAQEGGVYRHPDGYFEVELPEGWQASLSVDGIEFQAVFRAPGEPPNDPETAFRVLFVPRAKDSDQAALEGAIEQWTREATERLLGGKPESRVIATRRVEVAGLPAHDHEVTQVNERGATIRGHVVGTVGPAAIFFLIYYAPDGEWAEAGPLFEKMLATFGHREAVLAAAEPSSELVGYRDPGGVFRLEIPANWIPQVEREEGGVRYHFLPKRVVQEGADPVVLVFLQHFSMPARSDSLAETVRVLKENLLAGDPNLEVLEEKEVRAGELPAVLVRYRAKAADGREPLLEDITYVRKGDRVVVLVAASPESLYASHREAFARIAASLVVE
ncbi:MAG: hypothetical protein HY720_02240 [Planctomycetes bacterium]|nr:hypothetical protein [Planctomycetota bacterium]